jgi:cytochrome P450
MGLLGESVVGSPGAVASPKGITAGPVVAARAVVCTGTSIVANTSAASTTPLRTIEKYGGVVDDLTIGGYGHEPHLRLAQAREDAPVVYSETHRAWVALSHQAVSDGFRDARLSSDRLDAFQRLARSRPAAFQIVVDVLSGWMVFRDPPVHTRLREPVRAAFTPKRLAALEPRIVAVVDELLDRVAESGEADLRRDVSSPLPAIVIAELLGVPPSDRQQFQSWSDQLGGIVFAASSADANDDAAIAGASAFASYFGDLVEHYRAHPADNLVSAIAAAGDAGSGLQPAEVVGACAMLLFAGHETTTGFLANALWTLFEHPDQLERWRHDRELDSTAIEELMRFEGPATVMIRRAVEDFEWLGADVKQGQWVYLCIGAANRDPVVFEEPQQLDLGRDPNPHLGFGWGLHHCLGAPLARMESRIALRRILDRFPDLEPIGTANWMGGVLGRSSGPVPVRL